MSHYHISPIPCACGQPKSIGTKECRACWKVHIKGNAKNSYRLRPDMLARANKVRKPCPKCGRILKASAVSRHMPACDPWDRIDASGDCWEWTGPKQSGYGFVTSRRKVAHRWVWEQLVGEIPPRLVLDHLCRNIVCVNPDHLEPVTITENTVARGFSPTARKVRGHIAKTGRRGRQMAVAA